MNPLLIFIKNFLILVCGLLLGISTYSDNKTQTIFYLVISLIAVMAYSLTELFFHKKQNELIDELFEQRKNK